jgi:hypothetical protein
MSVPNSYMTPPQGPLRGMRRRASAPLQMTGPGAEAEIRRGLTAGLRLQKRALPVRAETARPRGGKAGRLRPRGSGDRTRPVTRSCPPKPWRRRMRVTGTPQSRDVKGLQFSGQAKTNNVLFDDHRPCSVVCAGIAGFTALMQET